jgi:choline kinase
MILIVLASGRGSRLGSLTKNKPKCLIKIYKSKTLIDYISKNFEFFEKVIVVTGYKSDILKKNLKFNNIKFIYNINYSTTNMVESLMLAKSKIKKNDIIVSYSDIFFDQKILKLLIKKKNNILPLNINWVKSWRTRYKLLSRIKKDAENIIVNKKRIKKIGGRIMGRLPKLQYMGILKITNNTFLKMYKFYKELNDKKINMTEFINLIIQKKIANFDYMTTNKFWYEVDNAQDLRILRKEINFHNLFL